jgi:hypothetical protein
MAGLPKAQTYTTKLVTNQLKTELNVLVSLEVNGASKSSLKDLREDSDTLRN